MATIETQQPWVPFEPTKDCSQGFCSIYCPQWCYIIFPPPPPLTLSDDDNAGSGTAFSPLVISIIGILATAFLLVSYYTIVSKYCGASIRRSRRPPGSGGGDDPGQPRRHEAARASSNGLDEALINKITTHRYRRGEGAINGTDCPVCLGEFREDDSLRLLPKCRHAFHLHCIDTWLKSHSNCPLCRANIVSAAAESPPLPQSPSPPPPPTEPENNPHDREMVVVTIEDVNRNGEEVRGLENGCDASKDPSLAPSDSGGRQQSCDSSRIGDDGGVQPIRRSVSGGRFCFTGNGGRGRSPVLPT